jgi:hypothetical protein
VPKFVADSSVSPTGLKWAAPAGASPASDSATVTTEQTTTSTSYTDLATSGPAVTLTTGTKALVIVSCSSKTSEAGYIVRASYAVSGATTIAANDDVAIWNQFNDNIRYSAVSRLSTLTAGSNTFTMKYRINNATRTATFGYREICVIDLGS